MPTLVLDAHRSRAEKTAFERDEIIADVEASTPIQGDEGKRLVKAAEAAVWSFQEDKPLRGALAGNSATITNYNADFEADVDEPMTLESLAERHRRFLDANQQDWEDVDLPSPFK